MVEGYELVLVGDGHKNKEMQEYLLEHSFLPIQITGYINRNHIAKIYEEARLVVLASQEEGFGLPVIEGYAYGIPAVAFRDLDAIDDLYDKDTMVLVDNRTDQDLATGIRQALNRRWDRQKIMEFSEKFSSDRIGDDYSLALKTARSNKITMEDINILVNNVITDITFDKEHKTTYG